jgi:membrane dipeptidase
MSQPILVFDGHNDTLLKFWDRDTQQRSDFDFFARNENSHIDFPRGKEAHFAGGFFAVFSPTKADPHAVKKTPEQLEAERASYMTKDGYSLPLADSIDLAWAQQSTLATASNLFPWKNNLKGNLKLSARLMNSKHVFRMARWRGFSILKAQKRLTVI